MSMPMINNPRSGKGKLRVPLYDPKAHFTYELRQEMHAALDVVITDGFFHGGAELDAFEERFGRFTDSSWAIGVNSGTIAIYLTLLALGVGPGDEVITVPNSDIATTSAIRHTGARVVWVDVLEETHNLDPTKLEAKISDRTKVLLPVHLYGLPADMDPILAVADRFELQVVEDCALALGASYEDRQVGTFGVAGCFSFSETKLLGALGTGGMITTNDADLRAELQRIRSYGEAPSGMKPAMGQSMQLEREGLNVGLGALQAAFLNRKMDYLGDWLARRKAIAAKYASGLRKTAVQTPDVPEDRTHAYRSYVVRVQDRDEVRTRLHEMGIATATHYAPPLHLQPVYRDLGYQRGDFPVAERLAGELLCLPIYPEMTDKQVELVIHCLREAVEENS